ncbi:hypothetical protein Q9L58_004300 [Maublancomyces gigas]|uniref:Uncharacterized protein n=1 Tax=Discina gigas TaxID=1032678 RepID=A0ABR3GLA1_9PEZI
MAGAARGGTANAGWRTLNYGTLAPGDGSGNGAGKCEGEGGHENGHDYQGGTHN